MRKTLVFILTLALLIPSMASFAATGAENLYDYGFIAGADGDLMVDKSLTRAEATVLLSEMYGKKEEAENFIFVPTFTDVKAGDWYAPYIGYARVAGWVSGYEDNSFKPKNPISQREWAAMLMKVMGYEFPWVDVLDEMDDVGIEVEATIPSAILRGEAFEAMWQAVNLPRKGETIRLGESIGRLDPEVPEEPEEPALPDFLTIEEIKADTLVQIELIFNMEVDTKQAEDSKTYSLSDERGRSIAIADVTYDEKNDSVRLILKEAVEQQEELTLEIEELDSITGLPLEDYEETFQMIDRTFPKVIGATVIGREAIAVDFSEPIAPKDTSDAGVQSLDRKDFVVDDGDIYIRSVKLENHGTRAVIETYTAIKEDVTVEAKSTIKDYAGYSINTDAFTADYVKDDEDPKLVGYKNLSPVGITLIWSETIRLEDGSRSNFYHSNTRTLVDSTITSSNINGNEMTLSFTNNPMPEGTVRIYVDGGAVSDYWANENPRDYVSVEIEEDNEEPEVVEIEVLSEDEIRITFSEPMNNAGNAMTNRSNYQLFDEKRNEIRSAVLRASYDASDYEVTLKFYEALNGFYSLLMEDLTDASGNELLEDEHFFDVEDLTAPDSEKWIAKAYFVGEDDQMLRIIFDEPMATSGKYSVLDLEKYQVNGINLSELDEDEVYIESVDDGKAVEIMISPDEHELDVDRDTDPEEDDDVVIARVADEAGNYTSSFINVIDLQGAGSFTVKSAELIRADRVKVVFTDEIVGLEPSDIRIYLDDEPQSISKIDSGINDDGVTEIIYTLRNDLPSNAEDVFIRVVDDESVNRFGETLDQDMDDMAVVDRIGPVLDTIEVDGDEVVDIIYSSRAGRVVLTFTEDIDPRTVSLLSFEVMNYEITDIGVSGDRVYIYIDEDDQDLVERYDEVMQKVEIRDLSGNGVDNITGRIQKIN